MLSCLFCTAICKAVNPSGVLRLRRAPPEFDLEHATLLGLDGSVAQHLRGLAGLPALWVPVRGGCPVEARRLTRHSLANKAALWSTFCTTKNPPRGLRLPKAKKPLLWFMLTETGC